MSDISKPHDRFFRKLFSRPDVSSDFLRNYLPPDVVRHLDTRSLELSKDTFIDDELRDHFSDILAKVRLIDGGQAYVYTLLEHKSRPDTLVAFQLLRYMTRIWEQDYRNYEAEKEKRKGKGKKSEPFRPDLIIPVVIYHGKPKWNISEKFGSLFDCSPDLESSIPDFSYFICDLSRYEDEEIRGMLMLRIGLLIMKYIFREDLADRLKDIFSLSHDLMNQTSGVEYIKTVLNYLANGAKKVSKEDLSNAIASIHHPKGGDLMPTLAEQWIREGKEEGEKIGEIKGRKGALLDILEDSLEFKFGEEGLKLLPEIGEIQDDELLKAIHKKLWTAESPDDLRKVYYKT